MDHLKVDLLNDLLAEKEQELLVKQEELDAQRGMLSAAIQELVKKNQSLENTLGELKIKNNELSGLLYNASHGLKTPATSVQAFVQLLRNEPLNDPSIEYVNYLERVSDQIIEIMTALTSLSTISRLNKENLVLETVDVDQIIKSNIQYCHKLSSIKNIQLRYTSKPLSISTVSVALNEIVKQLTMNGIVFRQNSDDGYVSIDFQEFEDSIVLKIEDNGEGIHESIQDKIYDMFFRGSEKSGGSGLGLYLVRKAAELLNANIYLNSASGKTVFEVQIPKNS